jgi:hypothetical protein
MVNIFRITIGLLLAIVLLLIFSHNQPQTVSSQDDEPVSDCAPLVEEALQILGSACAEVGRNEACYGHTMVNATFRDGATDTQFSTSGDISPIIDMDTLITEPIDLEAGTWGVAMMHLQADLPEADEASSMTLVLFGDTEVINTVDPTLEALPQCTVDNQTGRNLNIYAGPGTNRDTIGIFPSDEQSVVNGRSVEGGWVRIFRNGSLGWIQASELTMDCNIEMLAVVDEADDTNGLYARPMQSFSLQTGNNSICEDAPDGLLVESPSGQRAHVMVNGVELEFASTGFLSADPDGNLLVSGLDGEITVRALLETVQVLPGFETRIPLLDGLPIDIPEIPFEIESLSLGNLPEGVLEGNLRSILDQNSIDSIDRARRELRDLDDLDLDEFIPDFPR